MAERELWIYEIRAPQEQRFDPPQEWAKLLFAKIDEVVGTRRTRSSTAGRSTSGGRWGRTCLGRRRCTSAAFA